MFTILSFFKFKWSVKKFFSFKWKFWLRRFANTSTVRSVAFAKVGQRFCQHFFQPISDGQCWNGVAWVVQIYTAGRRFARHQILPERHSALLYRWVKKRWSFVLPIFPLQRMIRLNQNFVVSFHLVFIIKCIGMPKSNILCLRSSLLWFIENSVVRFWYIQCWPNNEPLKL